MKNRLTNLCALIAIYLLSIHQLEHTVAVPAGNGDSPRNRGALKYNSRLTHFRRVKPETFANEFEDDDDIFDLSKRQHGNSDDYGHLRFGKRDEQFEDYGHMRFGRNGGEKK